MRTPLWLAPLAFGACAAARPADARALAPVHYRIDLTHGATQYVYVEARIPSRAASTKLALPAWTPGSYKIRDFAKHVYGFTARSADGTPLRVEMVDKQTWSIDNDRKPFSVRYRVFAATPSVRTSLLDDTHASINGASIFMFEPGRLDRPHHVELKAPDGWKTYTALPKQGGALVARNYDVLVDSPIEVGTPTVQRYTQGGTAFEYVLTSPDELKLDRARLLEETQALTAAFGEMMGSFPMKRYVFLMHVGDVGGGGLEHADSTMMMMRSDAFTRKDGYERAAQLLAHEFFHLWNVKRIHDEVLGPFDYLAESYSPLLWFHEGFTETIENLAMRRSGLWTAQQYLDHIGRAMTAYRQKPGRDAMPLSEVSFRAWTHGYQPEKNHRNETISYYEKGNLLGLCLDLRIRLESQGKGSLPGVFRRLMRDYGAKNKGITVGPIVDAASAEAGVDLSDVFSKHVDGVEPLPLVSLLEDIGVVVNARPVWIDPSGADAPDAASQRAWVGLELRGTTVRNVVPGSPAEAANIMRGDEIIAVQGRRVESERTVRNALGRVGPGGRVSMIAFRGSRLIELELDVQESPYRIYTLSLPDTEPGPALKAWLGLG